MPEFEPDYSSPAALAASYRALAVQRRAEAAKAEGPAREALLADAEMAEELAKDVEAE